MGINRFGVVRFDADDPNMGGWASAGGKAAYRISSVGNLDNDTLWWTNLSFSAMFNSNLHKTPFIKRTGYLNNWLQDGQTDFCLGWGFIRRLYTEKEITEALSAIFDHVMRFAEKSYDLDFRRSVPGHDNLADELRCAMLPDKDPHLSPEVDSALYAAHQYYSFCLTPYTNKDETSLVKFSAPAVPYAQEMMGTIIPSDQVDYISGEKLPPVEQRIDWVVNSPHPMLARVTVSNVNPDYVNVIAFANGAKAGSNRSWVSQPELLLLSKYADVDVTGVFVFSEYTQMPEACRLPQFSTMQSMTPAAEIVATNHWLGLAKENPYRLETVAKGSCRMVSPRATWITAIDRFHMFTYALQLHRAGIVVRKYGAGSVFVVVPKHNYRDAYDLATQIGLLAPPNLVNDIEVQGELENYG